MTTGKPSLAMQQLDGAIKTLNTMQYAEPIYAVLVRVRAERSPRRHSTCGSFRTLSDIQRTCTIAARTGTGSYPLPHALLVATLVVCTMRSVEQGGEHNFTASRLSTGTTLLQSD